MLDLGVEPVVASDGYTYRLSPLMTWCARFDYGSCTSPLTRETIRPEVYYNQDLEVVMNTWGDQVRRKRHGTTMSWVQRFCADTVVICPDGGGHGGGCPRRPQRAATAGPGTRCRKNGATVVGAPAGADRMPILERRLRTPRNPRA
ncbi:hypothetical protein PBRA_007434 [Plasmodiophora brassicae]|uniref:Uncharacterized protein n=1 Tax=Plasmodiophora brassicae TaxID=37360 RepID=A0A0G4IXD4_PLABS|nr:hypothetical protein PBRA_007434 [Plasmodiophora brassicae]